MPEWITPRQFTEADGVDDWRVLGTGVFAHFRTGSFATGVALADAIGELAGATGTPPDVDPRSAGVTVRLPADGAHGLGSHVVQLAREVSAAARALDVPADPAAVQELGVTIDTLSIPSSRPFWRALLGYREVGEEDLVDPHSRAPGFRFQQIKTWRPQRDRLHIDVWVPHDQAEARVAAALAAGGKLVTDAHAPAWWVLVDGEGNQAYVATWMGRD
jgi:4a-hydroxytetrahydrobiopterin dehydratase